jgi:molecular chaperone HtpG
MFITDEAELLPPWLRFVQGVVDTEDLPLNVSREMLQSTPVLARIRKAVTGRVLSELKTRAKDEADYAAFWRNFGPVLKEGVWEDDEYRKDLAPLLRFRSTAVDGWTSLPDYVGRMKPGQDAIYFLAGEREEALANSPQLEGFRARGIEVLLLSDPIDAFWPDRLDSFDGRSLRSVTQAAADLERFAAENASSGEAADVSRLVTVLKDLLKDEVSDVQATERLVDSAVVLAAGDKGPDLHMQRLLRRAGRQVPGPFAILQVNARHPVIRRLAAEAEQGGDLKEKALILLELAQVQEGEMPRDPASFVRRVTSMLPGGSEEASPG